MEALHEKDLLGAAVHTSKSFPTGDRQDSFTNAQEFPRGSMRAAPLDQVLPGRELW